MKGFPCDRNPRRGGLLITALILMAVIGIALTSYLSLSRAVLQSSHRNLYLTAAVDLAEVGLEHGMWALNAAYAGTSGAWTGWSGGPATPGDANAWRKFTGFSYDGGGRGEVSVYVVNYQGGAPHVVSKAVITMNDGRAVEKWMRVIVKKRSLFGYGLLARDTITASGGAYFDSWISDPDGNPATPPVAYSSSVARNFAPVATVSSATPSISLGSADLYGTVAVGAKTTAGVAVSWGGQVGPRGMPISGSYNIAPGALSTEFSASFETVTPPTGATVRAVYKIPYNLSVAPYYVSAENMGTTGAATIYQMDKVTVEGAATLTIRGDVTLILPPTGVETLKVAGSGKIVLATNATLTIYTPGNIDISGAGIANPSAPEAMQIWSTRNGTSGQTIKLEGSGALSAIIYAPDAVMTLPGGVHFSGAAVVKSATLSGSGAFHYDESLKNFGGSGSLGIESYTELETAESREDYVELMEF